MATTLIVEDESVLRLTFRQFLEEDDHEVFTAEDYGQAVKIIDENDIDVIVTDIILGGKTGVDLLRTARERGLDSPVIMITGDPNVETASEAVRLGAFDYLPKPVTGTDLKRVVRLALDRKAIAEERDLYARKMERYQRELETTFNSVNEGIITVDNDLRVHQINAAARAMFDLGAKDLSEIPFEDFLPDPACDALKNTVETHEGATDIRIETSLRNGKKKVFVVNTAPLVAEHGARDGAVLVARDITRLNLLEEQLHGKTMYRNMIGKSPRMKEIFSLIDDLSETDSTVLICGESGTGKELVAEALHESSTRAHGPFVKVNCAALSEDILESELFGHVKGAFTGAVKDRIGRFESAIGGTILLDEIGDISPRLQLRLLRVLQEREFERVGDSRPIRADVRVIAASNQDLIEKIKAGEFRQDLYYRLNVVRIEVPPIRERREDMPLFVDYFCKRFNALFKKEITGVAPETMDVFMNYPWMGNVRELENCMERAFIVCHEPLVLPKHLPPEIKLDGTPHLVPEQTTTPRIRDRSVDKERLLEVFAQTDWNVAKSARILGIARNTLYQKMKAYGLSR